MDQRQLDREINEYCGREENNDFTCKECGFTDDMDRWPHHPDQNALQCPECGEIYTKPIDV